MYKSLGENAQNIADKRFGQNFLKDESVLNKIIEAKPNDGLPIVEIGPGLGDLTRQLLKVGRVRAYEVDKRLCEYLKDEFKEPINSGNLELMCKDILEHSGSLYEEEYSLIANLPYYIATKIVLNALHDSNCKNIIVMVQKEVAKKFAAKVGEREFSSLSILAQSVGEAKILFDVAPTAFVPPPKVTSAILYIEKFDTLKDLEFEQFLKVATKQPRKTLYKNLSTSYNKELLKSLFLTLNIKSSARPHEVELSIYHHLYKELKKDKIDESRKKRRAK
jgi:16S rRNA (adenine1518-N6/adenine1519-N6)-dimethyltransferase